MTAKAAKRLHKDIFEERVVGLLLVVVIGGDSFYISSLCTENTWLIIDFSRPVISLATIQVPRCFVDPSQLK